MAATGFPLTIAGTATQVFSAVDGLTYAGLTSPAKTVIKTGTGTDPVPIWITFPASGTVLLGSQTGCTTTATAATITCAGQSLFYNVVGGDSLYASASGSPILQILLLRQ